MNNNIPQPADTDMDSYPHMSCSELPPKVNSLGIWTDDHDKGPIAYSLPLLQIQILLILAVVYTLHFTLKHLGIPKVISEILGGMLLSGAGLGRFDWYSKQLLNVESENIIGTLSTLGYTLFIFLSAVKMDMGMISTTGTKALGIGVLSLLTPLILGMAVSVVFLRAWPKVSHDLPFVAIAHSVTSFPVITALLSDLKILNSELGRLSLSSALVSNLCSIFLTLISVLAKTSHVGTPQMALLKAASTPLFVLGIVYILRPAMLWVVAQTPEGRPVKEIYIYAIIFGMFSCALLSDFLGQYVMFGAFIFGLAVPDGPPLGSALVEKLDAMVSVALLPIFTATCAMRISVLNFSDKDVVPNVAVTLVSLTGKILACWLPLVYFCKMPQNDALAVGLIMSAHGTVNMATNVLLRETGVVTENIFSIMAIVTTVDGAMVPFLVRRLYDPSRKYAGYQRRDILHSKPNSELRILACVHDQEGVTSVINLLLDISNPTEDNPVSVYLLHLIELVGRATPIFISHDLQKRVASNHSYSEHILHALNRYWQNKELVGDEDGANNAAMVHVFTAISPPKLMNEDICTLALNKMAVIIIIPFHRKWGIGGAIESDEQRIRSLNCSVLDMAPCSIGILVDRTQVRGGGGGGRSTAASRPVVFFVAVIFLGGDDDREGLAYAIRLASGPQVELTVFHLQPMNGNDQNAGEWESFLDNESLKDIKHRSPGFERIKYVKRGMRDGPHTTVTVRSMANQFDLIIVGRRDGVESPITSGLTADWSEYPELGILGDLLAASDFDTTTSVLVVQQQRHL